MPLDRRITINHTAVSDYNDYGEFVPGAVTAIPLWAQRVDQSQTDKEQKGGELSLASRAYMIRYRTDLVDAVATQLKIIDGLQTLEVTNITEATEKGPRRRFMKLEAIGEVGDLE